MPEEDKHEMTSSETALGMPNEGFRREDEKKIEKLELATKYEYGSLRENSNDESLTFEN